MDIEIPWKERNVQSLAVGTRALAEHVGIGSLAFAASYTSPDDAGPATGLVVSPPGPQRLSLARRKMGLYLSVQGAPYDDLTILAGFAHPGRFSMQV